MSFLIDIIIVAVFALPIIIFAKKGFVFALVKVIGFVAAFIVATGIGGYLSALVYDNTVEPAVVSATVENFENGISNLADATFEAMPDFIKKNSEVLGITKETFVKAIPNGAVNEDTVKSVLETTIKPVVTKLLSTLITLIAFVVLLVAVGFLSRLLNKLFSFSVIGTLNRVLGGIIGIPIGVILAYLFCLLVELTLSFTSKGLWVFTAEAVDTSRLYNLLMSIF